METDHLTMKRDYKTRIFSVFCNTSIGRNCTEYRWSNLIGPVLLLAIWTAEPFARSVFLPGNGRPLVNHQDLQKSRPAKDTCNDPRQARGGDDAGVAKTTCLILFLLL